MLKLIRPDIILFEIECTRVELSYVGQLYTNFANILNSPYRNRVQLLVTILIH